MGFPFEIEEEEISEIEIIKEYEVNFETGELTGRIVEGLEAVKAWIYLALRVGRYKHLIYSWDYGNELEELIGKSYSYEYLNTEIPRMIEETLMLNKYINKVDDFEITIENDKLIIYFAVQTMFGEGGIQIDV